MSATVVSRIFSGRGSWDLSGRAACMSFRYKPLFARLVTRRILGLKRRRKRGVAGSSHIVFEEAFPYAYP